MQLLGLFLILKIFLIFFFVCFLVFLTFIFACFLMFLAVISASFLLLLLCLDSFLAFFFFYCFFVLLRDTLQSFVTLHLLFRLEALDTHVVCKTGEVNRKVSRRCTLFLLFIFTLSLTLLLVWNFRAGFLLTRWVLLCIAVSQLLGQLGWRHLL